MTRSLLLLMVMGWASTVSAGPFSSLLGPDERRDNNPPDATFVQPQGAAPSLSPGEAAERAQQMNGGGEVLSAKQAPGGWKVKLIKNGEVRVVFVPD